MENDHIESDDSDGPIVNQINVAPSYNKFKYKPKLKLSHNNSNSITLKGN